MIEALLLGVLLGTITGIVPSIHTNLVAGIVMALPLHGLEFVSTLIISLAIAHTITDFIPSVYLAAPNEETALSTLPGHRFLLQGRGHEAVTLTIIGAAISILFFTITSPFLFWILPKIYPFIKRMLGWILLNISIILIVTGKNKAASAIIFLLAGFLGIFSLQSPVKEPLLPLLSGLFGTSTIIISLKNKTQAPKQKLKIKIPGLKKLIRPSLTTLFISPISSLLPGVGSSQAAIIGSAVQRLSPPQFMVLLGSINTFVVAFSFVTLEAIQKTRTGAAAALKNLGFKTSLASLELTILISAVLASSITFLISKKIAKKINQINYQKISLISLAIIVLVVFIFSGFWGILVLLASTSLGILCHQVGARKGILMASLLVPTTLFYLPI